LNEVARHARLVGPFNCFLVTFPSVAVTLQISFQGPAMWKPLKHVLLHSRLRCRELLLHDNAKVKGFRVPLASGASKYCSSSIDKGAESCSNNETEPENDIPPLKEAQRIWKVAIETDPERTRRQLSPSLLESASLLFMKWLAIHQVRYAAAEGNQEGCFDNIETDLEEGAPQCLRFLAESLGNDEQALSTHLLQNSCLDGALSDSLSGMVSALRSGGCCWRWDIGEELSARIVRLFLVFGVSRSGVQHSKRDICSACGQQFVMNPEQLKRFLGKEASFTSRMEVLQELMNDVIVVADMVVTVKQRAAVQCPDPNPKEEPEPIVTLKQGSEYEAQHVLRLERTLSHGRSFDRNGNANATLSPWQIVDWNGLCLGNHPALPRGWKAPW